MHFLATEDGRRPTKVGMPQLQRLRSVRVAGGGKRAEPRNDPFADETTIPYEDGVPLAIDDQATRPVDVDEMEVAAKESCAVEQPGASPAALHARRRDHAEVSVTGRQPMVLPVVRVSGTGLVLALPLGVAIALAEDRPVGVVVHRVRDGAPPLRVRLPAVVVCHRPAGAGAGGGLSLRWDLREPDDERRLERLLAG